MTIEEILQALPSKQDLAASIGLEARSSSADVFTILGAFGTGIILGAGVALLLAPKAGHEIRHDLAEKVAEMSDQLRAHAPSANGPANGPTD